MFPTEQNNIANKASCTLFNEQYYSGCETEADDNAYSNVHRLVEGYPSISEY